MKERIVKSALNLFWRYGIKSVTMDDIAKELGISKRTIYQHYSDKEAILKVVIQEELSSQQCDMEQLDEMTDNPIDQMIQATDQMRTAMAHMNPALLYDLKKYYPESWGLFQSYKHEFILKGIRDNMYHGISLGFYRPDIDVDVLSLLRIEEFEIAFDPSIFPPDKFHMMRVQMQFVHHFLRGIMTEKGFEYYNTIKDKSVIEFNTHEK
ncbi:TetR/AcrR family transcriptional regulator [Dyadobacter sp. CY312]|uniref:TetR/AcrR family transcriptional regulator n=1 Tax=Dyadobacter sp. CY312 TaxID=2907303 RepID=UPI001F26CCEA|nr:TetR/AcrR family transcriptional regulator [Dyadobacter sp. CY312]MCE7043587.1 TetR/AcrR family transcriptional regulator [Dyadobacter sp. CY312]